MKKKLFKNYDFEFDKNEAKLITTFCKQAIGQMNQDNRFLSDVKAFNSIMDKVAEDRTSVKLTKDEKVRFTRHLEENAKYIDKQISKSNFLKRWLLRSMYKQYNSLLTNHFKE